MCIRDSNYPDYAGELIKAGVENVLVSLGRDGAYFANRHKRYQLFGPAVEVINTVGCGDSMLACTVASLAQMCIRDSPRSFLPVSLA